MGALEKLKENREKLKDMQAKGIEEEVALEPEQKEEIKQEVKEEVKTEVKEDAKDAAKQEVKEEKSEAQRNSEARKQRLDEKNRLLEQQVAEANRRLQEMEQRFNAPKVAEDPEPNKLEDREGWLEWDNRQTKKQLADARKIAEEAANGYRQYQQTTAQERKIQQARDEAASYESQTRASNPDYDAVKAHYVNMLAAAIKLDDPSISNADLVKTIDHKLLTKLGKYARAGYDNPVTAMYEEVRGYYQPPKEEEEPKPDLNKVAKNRARNSGMAGVSGSGKGGELTASSVVGKNIPVSEWAKKSASEKRQILENLKQGRA